MRAFTASRIRAAVAMLNGVQVRWSALSVLALAVVVVVSAREAAAEVAAPPPPAAVERAADALSERLVAPCCWRESLRSHRSPLADELRLEIRTRLAAGEAGAAIERDLVARYGPRVRAFSPDWDPRRTAGVIVFAVIAATLGGLVLWMRRQRRHGQAASTAPAAPPASDDRLEAQLDDELFRDPG